MAISASVESLRLTMETSPLLLSIKMQPVSTRLETPKSSLWTPQLRKSGPLGVSMEQALMLSSALPFTSVSLNSGVPVFLKSQASFIELSALTHSHFKTIFNYPSF